MGKDLITPLDVAVFLETATEEDFLKAFVAWMKFHNTDSVSLLTGDEIRDFDISKCVAYVKDTLLETKGNKSAWWNTKGA